MLSTRTLFALACLVALTLFVGHLIAVPSYLAPLLNSAHGVVFFTISYGAALLLSKHMAKPLRIKHLVRLAAGLALVSLGLELSQIATARDADPADLMRDLIGVALGLSVYHALRSPSPPGHLRVARATGWTILGLIIFAPLISAGVSAVSRELRGNIILGFDTVTERLDYTVRRARSAIVPAPEPFTRSINNALRIAANDARYAVIDIERVQSDWQRFSCFEFDVWGARSSDMVVIVTDKPGTRSAKERYQHGFSIDAGAYRYSVSVDNLVTNEGLALNTLAIYGLSISIKSQPGEYVYVDNIRLKQTCSSTL